MSDETPVQCRACGGRGCLWCDGIGVMTAQQLMRWRRHQSGRRPAASLGERASTGAFDPHRAIVLERLAKAWDKAPERRLGELLLEALEAQQMTPEVLRTLGDKRLAELVEALVLYGKR